MSARNEARIRKNKLEVWRQYLELGRAAYGLRQFRIGDKMLRAASQESRADVEMCQELAATFAALAGDLAKKSEHEMSERLYKKALGIYDRVKSDETNARSCCILYELAQLSVDRNKHEVALRYFGKALIVSRRSQSLSRELHVSLLKNLAAAWAQKGRHSEAMMVHVKSEQVSAVR